MKQSIYIDTSVIGGCFDEEFAETSGQLFNIFKTGEAIIVVSDLTLLELQDAPPRVRVALDEIPLAHREDIELTEEAARWPSGTLRQGWLLQPSEWMRNTSPWQPSAAWMCW